MMNDKEQQAKDVEQMTSPRRKLFQLLVAAGFVSAALPRGWVKPVVKQIVLPAHAGLSVCPDDVDFDEAPDDCVPGPGP